MAHYECAGRCGIKIDTRLISKRIKACVCYRCYQKLNNKQKELMWQFNYSPAFDPSLVYALIIDSEEKKDDNLKQQEQWEAIWRRSETQDIADFCLNKSESIAIQHICNADLTYRVQQRNNTTYIGLLTVKDDRINLWIRDDRVFKVSIG